MSNCFGLLLLTKIDSSNISTNDLCSLYLRATENLKKILKKYCSDGTENIANGTAIVESPGRLIVNFAPVPIPGNSKSFLYKNEKKLHFYFLYRPTIELLDTGH